MEKKKNTPKLRFPEFTGEWEEKKLGHFFKDLKTGMTPYRGNLDYFKGRIPWITSGELCYNIILKTNEYITEQAIKDTNLKIYEPNTLFIAITGLEAPGTRGKCALNGIPAATNQSCMAFEAHPNINTRFLFYWYNKYGTFLYYKYAQGTKQQSFNNAIVENFDFIYSTLAEQTKIATFLTAVDEKLTQLKKKKTLLEQYKKGVMQKLFSQELRFKDDNNQDFPDWQEKTLGEMGETYNGLTGKNKDSFGTGKPYIQYKQIFDDSKIDVTRFELVEISYDEKQNKVKFGDIFFTVSSETPDEVGMSSVLLNEVEELYLNSFCFGYRPFSLQILSPFYARYLFRSEQFRKTVIVLAQGSTRYNLSKLGMMNLIIGLPSLPEQQKIATFLSSIDEKIIHCRNRLKRWKPGRRDCYSKC